MTPPGSCRPPSQSQPRARRSRCLPGWPAACGLYGQAHLGTRPGSSKEPPGQHSQLAERRHGHAAEAFRLPRSGRVVRQAQTPSGAALLSNIPLQSMHRSCKVSMAGTECQQESCRQLAAALLHTWSSAPLTAATQVQRHCLCVHTTGVWRCVNSLWIRAGRSLAVGAASGFAALGAAGAAAQSLDVGTAVPEPREVNDQLCISGSARQILDLVAVHHTRFDGVNADTALRTLAKLHPRARQDAGAHAAWPQLLAAAGRLSPSMEPRALSSTVWACG